MGYFDKTIYGIKQWSQEKREEAFDAMQDAALEGEAAMRERVLSAVTSWGSARAGGLVSGPTGDSREHPGRFETGEMYDSITSEVNYDGPNEIEARWGWQPGDLEKYFLAQEHGTDLIEPMEALAISLFEAEDYLKGRLNKIGD